MIDVAHQRQAGLAGNLERDAERIGALGARRLPAYAGKPMHHMLNTAWQKARLRAELPMARVHDLKHTFGRRLRAAGVDFEDRQDLLGHRSSRITTPYSAAELSRLIDAAEKVTERNGARPELVVLRGRLGTDSRKTHAS